MIRARIQGMIFLPALIAAFATWSLPPGRAGEIAAQDQSSSVRFAFGGNAAEIPGEFLDNLVFLPVRIGNGQPSGFLLDSTVGKTSIAPGRAVELGFAAEGPAALGLPGVQVSFSSLPAIANDHFAAQVGRRYQGALGNDFLASVVVELDYGRQTVRLYDPAAYKYSGTGTGFPLKFYAGQPIIHAKIVLPGQKAREGEFVVNTGLAASLVIFEKFAEGHHLFSAHLKTMQARDPRINNGDGIVIGRPKEFQIGDYTVEGAIAVFSPTGPAEHSDPEIAGEIGGAILRRFTVIFDYPHRQLILAPNLRIHELEQEDKSGLAVIAKGPGLRQFEISSVLPGTPAASAGIQKGDVIAGIDEDAAADLTLVQVRELFRQTSQKYKLTIERSGQTLQISLQTRRLL